MTTSGDAPPVRLRISYLFSQFPLPTEAFAVSDIAALLRAGHSVTVHTMKPARRDEEARMAAAAVPTQVTVMRPGSSGFANWPGLAWRRRQAVVLLLRKVLRALPAHPATALSALLCIPRVLEICEEITQNRSDVVHAFWSRHAGMVLPAMALADKGPRASAFVGAYDLVADDFLVDLSVASADVVFSHAETNRDYVTAKAGADTDVRIVHRGIPLTPPDRSVPRNRDKWITASALVAAKNVDAVLRIFAEAREKRSALRLDVCGDGPERARLEALATSLGCADAITFHGHVKRERLFAMMQRSGVFLMLSTKPSERLPNVVKEALWSGCALIVTRTEGIEELVPCEKIGHVVDLHDADAIARAVAEVLSETDASAEQRRCSAAHHIRENFSSDRSMARYIEAWARDLPEALSLDGTKR